MEKHLGDCLDNKSSKLDHWVWKWVAKNLPQLAALMVFLGHILPDEVLSWCSSTNDCLLKQACNQEQSMFWKVNLEDQDSCKEEGSYLYHDRVRGLWVRSGKTTGKDRHIIIRHLEHSDRAKLRELKDVSSKFYQSYPSQSATYSNNTRWGYFDQLDLYYGLAFDRRNGSDLLMAGGDSPFSLLNWPTDCIKKIKDWNLRGVGKDDVKEKQLHMASYLFEFGYDLCILPNDNVSLAPGFELIIGYQPG
jgi:hypothetical protein